MNGNACLCPAAIACATRALVSGGDPMVLDCDHDALDDLVCRCCRFGLCGARRYVDEDGDLVYEHVSLQPRIGWITVISPMGVMRFGTN